MLEQDGAVRARASKTSFWRPELEIEFEGDHYVLKKRSMWCDTVVLQQGNEEMGTIRHTAWHRRDAHIELDDRLPPVLQVFALWLTLLLWKRDAAASEGGA